MVNISSPARLEQRAKPSRDPSRLSDPLRTHPARLLLAIASGIALAGFCHYLVQGLVIGAHAHFFYGESFTGMQLWHVDHLLQYWPHKTEEWAIIILFYICPVWFLADRLRLKGRIAAAACGIVIPAIAFVLSYAGIPSDDPELDRTMLMIFGVTAAIVGLITSQIMWRIAYWRPQRDQVELFS